MSYPETFHRYVWKEDYNVWLRYAWNAELRRWCADHAEQPLECCDPSEWLDLNEPVDHPNQYWWSGWEEDHLSDPDEVVIIN